MVFLLLNWFLLEFGRAEKFEDLVDAPRHELKVNVDESHSDIIEYAFKFGTLLFDFVDYQLQTRLPV